MGQLRRAAPPVEETSDPERDRVHRVDAALREEDAQHDEDGNAEEEDVPRHLPRLSIDGHVVIEPGDEIAHHPSRRAKPRDRRQECVP